MGFSLKEFIFGGTKFCCCIPTRWGLFVVSFLTMIFGGLAAVIIWFEIASSHYMSPAYHAIFIIAGLVETALFIVSILGFVGAIVKKQLFITIYVYFLYFHFVLNLGVSSYLLWMVTHATNQDIQLACQNLKDPGSQSQCSGLLSIIRDVIWGVVSFLLLTEMYGTIVVTRYFRQLRREKRVNRESRLMVTEDAFAMQPKHARFASDALGQNVGLLGGRDPYPNDEFDPYYEHDLDRPPLSARLSRAMDARPSVHSPMALEHGGDTKRTALDDPEQGYGGGQWTHEQVADSQKAREVQMERSQQPFGSSTDEPVTTPRPGSVQLPSPQTAAGEPSRETLPPAYDFKSPTSTA